MFGNKIPMHAFASPLEIFVRVCAVDYLLKCNLIGQSVSRPSCIYHLPTCMMRYAITMCSKSHPKFLHF